MPIIINELEVVAEQPAPPPPASAPEAPTAQPTPHDIEQAFELSLERALRVWAS